MFGMIKLLPIILVVGGAGFAYHKVVINEKDNRITQQQMEIASKTQQNVTEFVSVNIKFETNTCTY